ncbi:UNVERIFIED_CONTAM: hypothetical protein FKN15_040709 [Acipenser sinensis]
MNAFHKNRYKLHEALALIEDDEHDFVDMTILPPIEDLSQITDKYSYKSDDEVEGNLTHLPAGILQAECAVVLLTTYGNSPFRTHSHILPAAMTRIQYDRKDHLIIHMGNKNRRYKLHKALALIEDDEHDFVDMTILPPIEDLSQITDKYSYKSDDEVEGNLTHLPAGILQAEVNVGHDNPVFDPDLILSPRNDPDPFPDASNPDSVPTKKT